MHELNHRVFLYQNEMSNFDNPRLETSKEDLIEMLYSALYLGGYWDTEIKKKRLMIQNQSKGDLNHPLERVLTATICQAMFNHDRSLETAWACGRVGEAERQTGRQRALISYIVTFGHFSTFILYKKKTWHYSFFFWKRDNSHKM